MHRLDRKRNLSIGYPTLELKGHGVTLNNPHMNSTQQKSPRNKQNNLDTIDAGKMLPNIKMNGTDKSSTITGFRGSHH